VSRSERATTAESQRALVEMEAKLALLPLKFLPHRSSYWEMARFPNMAAIYWNLARTTVVPEQLVFADTVSTMMGQKDNPAVIARASRAYPALVRQHHFFLVLKEHFPIVVRSEELDLNGVDLLVVDKGRAYGVALSVPTNSARSWQKVKQVRHPDSPEHLPVLYLYAKPDEYPVGQFWLHHPEQWMQVRAWIDAVRSSEDYSTAFFLRETVL